MELDLSGLNGPQREAVEHVKGPLVVFAGAGSGKTRVITYRIARLVRSEDVPPWRILAVTFTNKAAGEMRERLSHLVPGAAEGLAVGTFHSMCARLLRRHAEPLGLRRDFTIYDSSDQEALIKRVLRDQGVDDQIFGPRAVLGAIERAKQEMQDPATLERGPDTEVLRAIVTAYEKRKHAASALDFGDLIYLMVKALEENEAVHRAIAGRFHHVLVDEFQDTNHAQLRLVLALTSIHRNLCVVGDDDQSIYRWRGADRRNILSFREHFPDAQIIKLEQNYRSTKNILAAANGIISGNVEREEKTLFTENHAGGLVRVARCEDGQDEAALVVRTVRAARASGRSLSDVAVFYRIHAQSRVLEEALRADNIPYRVVGGMRFYERAEIKDLLAYLRVIANPEDDVSLLRIINVPARGIGKTSIERLLDAAAASGTGVWAAAHEAVATQRATKIGAFLELVEGLRTFAAGAEGTPPALSDLARELLERTGYEKALSSQDDAEGDARLENLAELIGAIEQFEETNEDATLASFLESVTLDTDAGGADANDVVSLMTVHAAKGLEFPIVLVTGLEQDLFPLRSESPFDREHLEEERRLAYVAMTRAREDLWLTWASVRFLYGQMRMNQRSRFIAELPPDAVQLVGQAPTARSSASSFGARPMMREPRAPQRAPDETWVDRSDSDEAVHIGMRMRHFRYGVGRIVALKGGVPPKVDVEFPDHGRRTIRADFLEPA